MDRNKLEILVTAKDEASRVLSGVSHGFDVLKKAVVAGTVVAGTAAVAFGVTSVKAFAEAQQASAQLEAVLRSTGGAAGVTKDQVLAMSSQLQSLSGISDEAATAAQSMLLTFTGIGKDVFRDATTAVADMATAMNSGAVPSAEQMRSTAILLGKALNNPAEGLTALTRVGVRFTEQQKEQITALTEAGRTADAQRIILSELRTEFGGSAEAAGKTFAGQLNILKNTFGDLQEEVGEFIVSAITPWVAKANEWLQSAGGLEGVIARLRDRFNEIITPVIEVARQVGDYLMPKFVALWNTVRNDLLPILRDLWQNILLPLIPVIGTLLVVAIGLVIDQINFWVALFSGLIKAIQNGNPVLWGLIGVFGTLATAMAFNAVFGAITAGFNTLTAVTIPSVMARVVALQALIASPLAFGAIAIGAALAALAILYDQAKRTQYAIDSAKAAAENLQTSNMAVKSRLQAGLLSNDPAVRERSQRALQGLGLAHGTSNWMGGRTWVGERGPELVDLPRGSKVHTALNSQSMATGAVTNIYGNIVLENQGSVDRFFDKLNRQDQLVGMGLK